MFCPDDCRHLNISEEQQDLFSQKGKRKLPHFCFKVQLPVLHLYYHPKLIQLDECKKEILFRKFRLNEA